VVNGGDEVIGGKGQQVHWVTGKGGVGKSAVAAALAAKFASQGLKTLLVELGSTSFYGNFLNLDAIGFHPKIWQGLDTPVEVALWSGEECLREYALYLIKVETLYRLFFENPVSQSLIQIAPGLEELAITGKATSSPRKHGPPLEYDRIVIDAFATGHFLSLLRAPAAMAKTIRFGPMYDQSVSIDRYLRDHEFTHFHLVTIPEDLPTTETLELATELRTITENAPQVWLNRWIDLQGRPMPETAERETADVFDSYLLRVHQRQESSLKRLNEIQSVQKLPMIWHTEPNTVLRGIMEAIK
jgi:anion-transporting  ArsA/GET3 family ATPase